MDINQLLHTRFSQNRQPCHYFFLLWFVLGSYLCVWCHILNKSSTIKLNEHLGVKQMFAEGPGSCSQMTHHELNLTLSD